MNTFLLVLVIIGVIVLVWKWQDTRGKIKSSPGYGKRVGIFYLFSAFTLIFGVTTVLTDAIFSFLDLNKPAHFEWMAFAAFIVLCTAAVLILRDKGDPPDNPNNNNITVGGDVGVLVNKPQRPVHIDTGMKKKVLTENAPRIIEEGAQQAPMVSGDAGIIVSGSNNTTYITSKGQKDIPKWLTHCPRFDETLIGREQDLQRLTNMINESKSVALINGMGGIGKTTLGIVYVNRFKDEYDHIVWLEQLGDFPDTILNNELLLQNLGIQSLSRELEKDVYLILNQLSNINGKCLLVIDNADQRIKPYTSHFPHDWDILITSRQELGFKATLNLDFLDQASARALFYLHYDHTKDDALVLEIIKVIGFHTLTIELLAKTAARKKRTLTLEKLWKNIQERGLRLGKEINISTPHSQQQNIEKIFPYLLSIFELQDLSEREQWLLKQFVCMPPTVHTFDELKDLLQLETDADIEILENGLLQLQEKGWLITDKASDTYKMHRIIQEVVSVQLDIGKDDVNNLLNRLITLTAYSSKENPVDKFQWMLYGKQMLIYIGANQSEQVGTLYNNIAGLYQDQGRYSEALTFYQKAIQISEAVLDPQHPDLASYYNNIAVLYKAQGRYDEALTFYQKDIQICKAVLDPQHPDLASSYNNIGLLYQSQGRYDEALTFLQKSIQIKDAILDPQHPDLASSYNNIGLLYQNQGRYDEALTFFQKAIQIKEAVLDSQHPSLASSYNNIGQLYQAQGRYDEALTFLQKSIQIKDAVLGPEHPSLANSYNNIGLLYKDQGQYDEALTFLQKSIQIQEAVLDPQHPDLANSYNNIAALYHAQGRYDEALTFFQKAIQIKEAVLDPQHPGLANSYNNIGQLYQAQGWYDEALTFLQKAIQIKEAVLDPQHPSLANSYNNIGLLYKDQGQYDEALTFLQKAFQIQEAILDPQHPDLANSYNNIAALYHAQAQYDEALTFLQKAIQIKEAVLGPQHPGLANSYNNIGQLYQAQGWYDEALTFLQKAIQIKEAVLDPQHPDLASSYNNIAALYLAQGRYNEALTFLQKAIQIMRKSLGDQHPDTQMVIKNLEMLKDEINRQD